jgi:DNA-directed RNA polymerase subunit RPC12/RpoP
MKHKAYIERIDYYCWTCGAEMSDEVEGPETTLECKVCKEKREDEEADSDD